MVNGLQLLACPKLRAPELTSTAQLSEGAARHALVGKSALGDHMRVHMIGPTRA